MSQLQLIELNEWFVWFATCEAMNTVSTCSYKRYLSVLASSCVYSPTRCTKQFLRWQDTVNSSTLRAWMTSFIICCQAGDAAAFAPRTHMCDTHFLSPQAQQCLWIFYVLHTFCLSSFTVCGCFLTLLFLHCGTDVFALRMLLFCIDIGWNTIRSRLL